ncbi:B-cell receptor CD22-like [Megalops cyprinoides]|uniref:B-cell receptor CD22-like n=1 Tax=Megalops cyprinoides TaxID=118141 RepID=UPI0018642D8E|nr:B-cell receptor CD22-like [Megalops cyprinoides]
MMVCECFSGALGQAYWGVIYTSENICALKGTSVNMTCTYTYPSGHTITKTFWFKNGKHGGEPPDLASTPEYKGRVEYLGDKKHQSTLMLKALKKSDSGRYYFRFITNKETGKWIGAEGSQLSVTALQARVNPGTVREGRRVTLTCSTSCTLSGSPAFIWYRNGHPLPNSTQNVQFSASSDLSGSYSCAVRVHESLPSSAVTLKVTYSPKNTSVSVSPSGEIVEGSSVTLTCSSNANPPVQRYTWFKNDTAVTSERGSGRSYSITNISSEDSGQYYCEAKNKHGAQNSPAVSIDVQYAPQSTSVSVSPPGEIVEGSSITLTCSSNANPPVQRYTWFKKNDTGVWQTGSGKSLNFANITSSDSGQYYCEAKNKVGNHKSTGMTIDVLYAPRNTSASVSPSGEIVEGSSVTLTCSSNANPPVQNYTWFKKNDTGEEDHG